MHIVIPDADTVTRGDLPLDGLRDALLREYEKLVKTRLACVLQMVNLGGGRDPLQQNENERRHAAPG